MELFKTSQSISFKKKPTKTINYFIFIQHLHDIIPALLIQLKVSNRFLFFYTLYTKA